MRGTGNESPLNVISGSHVSIQQGKPRRADNREIAIEQNEEVDRLYFGIAEW